MGLITILQHVDYEGPGKVADWLTEKGFTSHIYPMWDNPILPDPAEVSDLIILGGPMSTHEEIRYPWLVREKGFIENVLTGNGRILGICLGAQLLAEVLGAPVVRNKHLEIGWLPIHLTPEACQHPFFSTWPQEAQVFQWHGDTFELPEGALRIATSEGCQNQGFLYKERVIGLQFHLEFTPEMVKRFIRETPHWPTGPFVQPPESLLSQPERFDLLEDLLVSFLEQVYWPLSV